MREFTDEDVNIVYCDDDRLFEDDFLGMLDDEARNRPDECLCYRGLTLRFIERHNARALRLRGRDFRYWVAYLGYVFRHKVQSRRRLPDPYIHICEGFGGVLVKPRFFPDPAVFDIPDPLWLVDDIWLSGHMTVGGTRIRQIGDGRHKSAPAETWTSASLAELVVDGLGRHELDYLCMRYFQDHFGIWK